MGRARPEFRLVLRDPVGFGLALEKTHGVAHADGAQCRVPPPAQRRDRRGPSLVEPDHGRAQGLAVGIQCDGGAALGGDDHATDGFFWHPGVGPQQLAGLAQAAPEGLGVVFQPARLRRLVGVDGDLGFVQQVAVQVEQQGAHALGAVVDGQDAGDGHGAVRSQAVRCVGRLVAPASGDAAAGHRPLHLRIDVSML